MVFHMAIPTGRKAGSHSLPANVFLNGAFEVNQ